MIDAPVVETGLQLIGLSFQQQQYLPVMYQSFQISAITQDAGYKQAMEEQPPAQS